MEESTGSSSLSSWIPRPSSTKQLWRRGKLLLLANISPCCFALLELPLLGPQNRSLLFPQELQQV